MTPFKTKYEKNRCGIFTTIMIIVKYLIPDAIKLKCRQMSEFCSASSIMAMED